METVHFFAIYLKVVGAGGKRKLAKDWTRLVINMTSKLEMPENENKHHPFHRTTEETCNADGIAIFAFGATQEKKPNGGNDLGLRINHASSDGCQ